MRLKHGWPATIVAAALITVLPAQAGPRRVVSTFLCTDEYVFRLVPREDIAALSYEAGLRRPIVSTIADQVGGIPFVHNSAEEVLEKKPDLVVMYAGTQVRLHAQLREAGIRIVDVPWANSLAEIRSATLDAGRALGAEAKARALLEDMDRALAAAHSRGPRVRALIYESNGYASTDTITSEIMNSAGLVDVAHEIGVTRSGSVPLELLVASPPDLLILDESGRGEPSLANLVLAHPALADIADKMVVGEVSLTPLSCPGPWSADIAGPFAQWGDKARALARTRARP